MEVYLVRHTRVKLLKNICYGQTDVELADSFEDEYIELEKKIPDRNNMVCYSSPLTRCKKLANKLFENKFQTDLRLMELNFGSWENKTWDEIGKDSFDIWHSDFVNNPIPDGESYQQLSKRVISFWEEIKLSQKNIVLISHAGVIRALLSFFLGLPLENSFRLNISYGGITKVILNDNLIQVEYINK